MVHFDTYCSCCPDGKKHKLYVADTIAENLQRSKVAVLTKGWDYVCIVSGLPGVGKSTFAQSIAKFFDSKFESCQICFTAKEFREKTALGKKGQAFILDESFADLNTSLSKDPEFIATINHLQLIRQKNLFLILVLPDFFSLSKNIAIFRANHLFVPYSEDYSHGDVAVFDREAKRELYIKGKQFLNYQAYPPNFRCDYQKSWFVDEQDYLKRKEQHLIEQAKVKEKGVKASHLRDLVTYVLKLKTKVSNKVISEWLHQGETTVDGWVNRGKERYAKLNPQNPDT